MSLWMALLGCLTGEAASGPAYHRRPDGPGATVPRLVEVAVSARVEAHGAPAAWTAVARAVDRPTPESTPLGDGVCRSVRSGTTEGAEQPNPRRLGDASAPDGAVRLPGLRLDGPMAGALEYDPARDAHVPTGPRGAVDPAWVVGDLRWNEVDAELRVDGALRFGPVPEVSAIVREDDGAVTLRWDPATVDDARIHAWGPAGELVCGVGAAGVRLPWWSVPALGGRVILASTRSRVSRPRGDVLVRVRATVERVLRLDTRDEVGTRAAPGPQPSCGRDCERARKRSRGRGTRGASYG